jgi:hypothetical protein
VARIAQGTASDLILTRRTIALISPSAPAETREVHFVSLFNSTNDQALFTEGSLASDLQGVGVSVSVVPDPLTQYDADSSQLVPIIGLHVPGGPPTLPSPTRSARISSVDPAPREFIRLTPGASSNQMSVGFSIRFGPAFTPSLFITVDTAQIEGNGGEYAVCQLAAHPAYGLWVHTQAGVGALVPIEPDEWYWVSMLFDGPNEIAKMRVYRVSDWQYMGESTLELIDQPVGSTIFGRTDATHTIVDDFIWYGLYCGRNDAAFPIIPGEAYAAPIPLSATISDDGLGLTIVFSRACEAGAGGADDFVLNPTGADVTLAVVSGNGTATHVYSISRAILQTAEETAVLSYTQPGDGVQNLFGTELASFANFAVTNNSTQTEIPSSSPIEFIVAGADQEEFQDDITVPITLYDPAEDGVVLFKLGYYDTQAVTHNAPYFDGVQMVLVDAFQSAIDPNYHLKIYALPIGNLAAGTYDALLEVTSGTFRNASWSVEVYNHVNQTTPCGTPDAADGTSTTASVDVASALGEVVTGMVYGFSGSITVGAGQTARSTVGAWKSSDEDAATSVTHSYSQAASEVWNVMAVPLKPA